MRIFVFLITFAVFLTGVLFRQKYNLQTDKEESESFSEVLSQENEQISGDSQKDEEGEENKEALENLPDNLKPTETVLVLTPTFAPEFPADIFTYQYLGSEIITSSNSSLLLISTDETNMIINWYKEKIRNEGMSVKTFVMTKTNDEVLSKLVGADGEKEIRIEISKIDGSADTEVSVVFLENN